MNNKVLNNLLMLFVLFFISYGYFFQGGGWNQNIRICQIRAMIHQQTFIVDEYKEDSIEPPFEFVNTGDWAYREGHYYSNKSPGLSFLALVPFGVAECLLSPLFPTDVEKQVHLSTYVSTLLTTVLCSALLCILLFYVCSHFFKLTTANCLILSVFFGFGTLIFSYSTIFYGHLPAAFFGFLSFVLVMHLRYDNPRRKKGIALFSGFSAATAVLIEPSTVIVLACLALYMVGFREGRRLAPYFLLGCVPPGMVQCLYNILCFGGPLASSYQYANEAVMFKVAGEIFGFPRFRDLIGILALPERGLFVSSPVFLMALPGAILFFREKKWRAEALFCAAVSLSFILFIVSYYAWHHASTPGPRYLLPVFPFGFLLTVWALKKFPRMFMVVGILSILVNLTITLVGNEIPHDIEHPFTGFIIPHLMEGSASVNPVPFSNFENYSIEILADMDKWTPNFNAFNLGEVLFPHSLASVFLLFCFWAVWWRFWRKRQCVGSTDDEKEEGKKVS